MRPWKTAGIVILLSTVLASTACDPFGSPPQATPQQVTVTRGDLVVKVSGNGNLSFKTTRELAFGTGGKVAEVNVEQGDRVKQGQVLAKLDTATMERAVKAAELGVKAAELALKSAEIDRIQAADAIKVAEADVINAQSSVKAAAIDLDQATDSFRKITYPYTYSTFIFDVPQAVAFMNDARRQITNAQAKLQIGLPADQYYEASRQLKDAVDNLTRGSELLSRGEGQDVFQSGLFAVKDFWTLRAAQLQMDKARVALDSAQYLAGKTALTVDTARNALTKAQLAVDSSKNNIDTAKNGLAKARDELTDAVIMAPFDGVLARVDVKKGDVVPPASLNTTNLITIVDPAHMELNADIDEIGIPGVKVGQKVVIGIDALPETKFNGKVSYIQLLSKEISGVVYYTAKISFDVPPGVELRSGMSATADIISTERNNVLLLPNRALLQNNQGKQVVKVLSNGKVEERPVVTGITDSSRTEIVSGLQEGDVVVIERQTPTP